MPLIFEDESKKLGKKQVIVPDKLVNKIKANLNLFGKYKNTKGFKRANSIVDDGYNKRSNKKDKIHNGEKTISFSDLKRINHDLEHNNQNPNSLENILIGASNKFGDSTINTKTWAKDTLNKLRTSVKQVDAVPPVPKLEKNPLKAKDVQKDLKMGNATVRLTESLDDGGHPFYDYLEKYDAYYVLNDFFDNPKGKQNWGTLINPEMYAKALREFTKYGKLIHFPTKYVYQWMGIIMKNTAILETNSALAGHRNYGMYDEISDFAENCFGINIEPTYEACSEWLEEQGFYDWIEMPDGHFAITDYGTEPLFKIIKEYDENLPPEKVLVLVNRALDVYHMQGPICSIFIEGGQNSLNKISESIKGNNKKIIIDENKLLLLKEYHAQTAFNFDDEGNGYFAKNNWEHYVDFIEEIGKYGELPESEWDEYNVRQEIEKVAEDISIDLGDITDYDYEIAFIELINNTLLKNYEDKEDIFEPTFLDLLDNYDSNKGLDLEHYIYSLDIMDDPRNLDIYLTPYGYKEYSNILKKNFLNRLDEYGMPYNLKYNDRGLIYVERNIKIPKFNSPNFNASKDYFGHLNNRYSGIGNCFTWAEGAGEAYCGSSFGNEGSSEIKLKCWVDPKNVNWNETVYRNCYSLREEQEIYINDGMPIEIFDIVLECGTENGINVSGKSLLKQPIIVKT